MKTKFLFPVIFAFVASIFLSGCGKEGPPGKDGLDGLDGNANVIASQWYTPSVWAGQTGDWYFDISSNAISEDIV